MLYTIRDICKQLDDIDTRYLKVEVDGELKGACLKSDMESWIYQYGNPDSKRRIKQIFLGGATHDVRIGINLYPLAAGEFWDFQNAKDNSYMSKVQWRGVEVERKPREEAMAQIHPLVHWDSENGLIHFDDSLTGRHKKPNKKKSPKEGFFTRIKKWLKGDKGYKK